MKLSEALDRIESLSETDVIFAKRPWHLDTAALIGQLDGELRTPREIADRSFEYFIDVPVAREVLDVLKNRRATAEERRDLLLFYAQNDAYPSWIDE